MKASCSSTLLSTTGATEIHGLIDCAAQTGFQGINLDLGPHSRFNPEMFPFSRCGEIVRYAQAQAIEIQSLSGVSVIPAGDDEDQLLNKVICLSHALACPLVTVTLPERQRESSVYPQLLTCIRNAVAFASELDICLAVEAAPGSWIETIDSAIEFIDDVDRLAIGVVYDPRFHAMNDEAAPAAAAEIINSYTLMIRLSPPPGERIPDGRYEGLLQLFNSAGFSEYICDSSCLSMSGESAAAPLNSLRDTIAYLRMLNLLETEDQHANEP